MPRASRSAPPAPVSPADGGTPAALLRRVPQQDRGQRRVDRILDAAAEVIAEVGVEGASTNLIAARAKTSVGSLYQFFPNRDAIVHALAARYVAEFERLKDRVMAPEVADLPLEQMMRGIVEPIARYCEEHPAYRHVFAATNDYARGYSPDEARLHDAVVARVEGLIARRCPWVDEAQRRATARVQVETVHAVLFSAMGRPADERPPLCDELVRMLVCALEPFDRVPRDAGPVTGGAPGGA